MTAPSTPSDKKICSFCKLELDIDKFYKDKTHKDGYGNKCKSCMHDYIKKYMKTDKWKAQHRKKQSRFIKKHPERNTIYTKAQTVPLKPECERCGTTEKRLVRHHPDYSKPKDVITLCDKCHRALHKELLNA